VALGAMTLATGRTNLSSVTGTPDNGVNTFAHGWNLPTSVINENAIVVEVIALGGTVTAATWVGLSDDKLSLKISFTQSGSDQVTVIAQHVYSMAM
jgi:hypothetical protein